MNKTILSKHDSCCKQISLVATTKQTFSNNSDAIDNNSMPIQVLVKFPGNRITAVVLTEVPSLNNLKQALLRSRLASPQSLQNSCLFSKGRSFSNSLLLHDGDVICFVPRLLGGITPRGQLEQEITEPANPSAIFSFEEPLAFGSR
jgi:hypothetical protein